MKYVKYPFRGNIMLGIFSAARILIFIVPMLFVLPEDNEIMIIVKAIIGLIIVMAFYILLAIIYAYRTSTYKQDEIDQHEISKITTNRIPGYKKSRITYGFMHFQNKFVKVTSIGEINVFNKKVRYFSIVNPFPENANLRMIFIAESSYNSWLSYFKIQNNDLRSFINVIIFEDVTQKSDFCDQYGEETMILNNIVSVLHFEKQLVVKDFEHVISISHLTQLSKFHRVIYRTFSNRFERLVLVDFSRRIFSIIDKMFS